MLLTVEEQDSLKIFDLYDEGDGYFEFCVRDVKVDDRLDLGCIHVRVRGYHERIRISLLDENNKSLAAFHHPHCNLPNRYFEFPDCSLEQKYIDAYVHGRFGEAIKYIVEAIKLYNPATALVKIEDWNGKQICSVCNEKTRTIICPECKDEVCQRSNCFERCSYCDRSRCKKCLKICSECNNGYYCNYCLRTRNNIWNIIICHDCYDSGTAKEHKIDKSDIKNFLEHHNNTVVNNILNEVDKAENILGESFKYYRFLDRIVFETISDNIKFKDVELGKFRIQLHYNIFDNNKFLLTKAINPNHPVGYEQISHPHVGSDYVVCLGDGKVIFNKAIESGRLFDSFDIANSILNTYVADSSYWKIEDWKGTPCKNCESPRPQRAPHICDGCKNEVCEKCESTIPCNYCEFDYIFHAACMENCHNCLKIHCPSCLLILSDKQKYCRNCRKYCHNCDAIIPFNYDCLCQKIYSI